MTRCDYCGNRSEGRYCWYTSCAGSERGTKATIGVWRVLELARLLTERSIHPWPVNYAAMALAVLLERHAEAMPIRGKDDLEVWHKRFRQVDMVDAQDIDRVIWFLVHASPGIGKLFNAVAAARTRKPVEI